MTPGLLNRLIVDPVLSWLGEPFASLEASVMLLAIALQETNLETRDQGSDEVPGPALGLFQFEQIAVQDFQQNGNPRCHAAVLDLAFPLEPRKLWQAIGAGADHLAAVLARDCLWRRIPGPLPALGDVDEAWRQYVEAWKPGKPHPERWPDNYAKALETVGGVPMA